MITRDDLLSAIAECNGERNPNANTCMKLAAYQTILDHMDGDMIRTYQSYSFASEPAGQVSYDSGSEFSDTIKGRNIDDVLAIMDELMDTIHAIVPRLYRATIDRLKA